MERSDITTYTRATEAPIVSPPLKTLDVAVVDAPTLFVSDRCSRKRRLVRGALVTLLFAAMTFVVTYPVSLHPASMAFNEGDSLLNSWIIGWGARTLFTDFGNFFHGNILYPYRFIIAHTEHLVGLMPVTGPVFWLTGNALLAHNVALLASFVLSGVGTYLLVRHLTNHTGAAILAGVIFAFAPYKIAQLMHVQELSAQWMPLALLFLHRGLQTTRRWRDFIAFGACFTLQALSCMYYATYFACALALLLVCVAVFRRRDLRAAVLGKLFVVGLVSGAILLPLTLPYLRVERETGFGRGPEEVKNLSAALEDYLITPAGNLLYGKLTTPLRPAAPEEHTLFPGVLPVVLLIIALAGFSRLRRQGRAFEPAFYALLALLAVVLSLGPKLHVLGWTSDFPMPYRLFQAVVPGAGAMRVPSRFDVIVMLCVAVLAGYGLARVTSAMSNRRAAAAVCAVAVAVVFAEFCSRSPAFPIPSGRNIPEVYGWLATQDHNETVVAEIPSSTDDLNARYEYFSTYHWLRISNGHAAFMQRIDLAPDPEAIDAFLATSANLLVFHPALYPDRAAAQAVRARLDASAELEFARAFDDVGDRVYRVRTVPGSFDDEMPAGQRFRIDPLLPRTVRAGETFVVPLRASFADQRGTFFGVDRTSSGFASWDGGEKQQIRCVLGLVYQPSTGWDRASFDVTAPSTPGDHVLTVHLSGIYGARAIEGTRHVSVVASLPDSLEKPAAHRATIAAHVVPVPIEAGRRFRVDCEVANDGETVWLPKTQPDGRGWVGVRVRDWIDEAGKPVRDAAGKPLPGRVGLTRPLWPGQSLRVRIFADAPPKPGTYTGTIDLCSERVM